MRHGVDLVVIPTFVILQVAVSDIVSFIRCHRNNTTQQPRQHSIKPLGCLFYNWIHRGLIKA